MLLSVQVQTRPTGGETHPRQYQAIYGYPELVRTTIPVEHGNEHFRTDQKISRHECNADGNDVTSPGTRFELPTVKEQFLQ
jgi:hypothetical protein